ncbi:MAG: SUMF1/EgtB/PvdO family nonheme iron enzyme [bacterium]|nr:SUMF1/EgtB/PvdO family nonheme iron enzyme [bacterium]
MPTLRHILTLAILSCLYSATATADLLSHSVTGNIVELNADDDLRLRLTFLADDLLRVEAATGDTFIDEGSGAAEIVVATDFAGVDPSVIEEADCLILSTAAMQLIVRRAPLLLELRRTSDDELLWRERKPLSLTAESCTQTLTSDPDERIFGGGQQNGRFEFKGSLMEISYSGGWEEGDRPSPAPFYMSDGGYGVLRNTWADGTYDFRSDRYLTTTHIEPRFDAYYMVGASIREVLDLYTHLTGRARLLPRWALGYGDADCYNDGDNVDKPGTVPEGWSDGPTGTTPDVVESVAAKYREHDMPGSWILPNDGYGCGYVELPETVARLREHGFRTGLWTENGVEKIAWEIGTAGTRVQKLDVAWTGKGYQWCMDANLDAAQGFIDNADARPFIWTVMGWAGIQRYAVTWTGDQSGSWDYIRWHVPTLIGSGLSGLNYSTGDVDGIFGGSPETFTRDLQWKCFTPVLMGMSGWSQSARKHPWAFDEPYLSINRRYLKLRQRLMPYLYTLARETETSGAPMVRGMMWDLKDPHAYDHPYQFLLGRELLIAPVYRSQEASKGWREDVYLPEGEWIDYWTGLRLESPSGGRVVDVPVDLGTLPVFMRAGAIIPLYPESNYDGEVPADPLTLDIYPAGESEFVLYEDDGDTRDYLSGAFSEQRFAVKAASRRIDVEIAPATGEFAGMLEQRSFVVQLHTRSEPKRITLNGKKLSPRQTGGRQGWIFDEARGGVIHIDTGAIDVRAPHKLTVELDRNRKADAVPEYPKLPGGDGTIGADELMVLGHTPEEPGHPLENAFDGDPDTWFRTVRNQSIAYGPHEFTVALGGRRIVEGFRISPRNDKWWEYGQVRKYEVYMADVLGEWGEPVMVDTLALSREMQEVRLPPRAGRMLRFRILSTHNDENDPMVLAAADESNAQAYDALAPVRVYPTTISEFSILERPAAEGAPISVALAEAAGQGDKIVTLNGIDFDGGFSVQGAESLDFALTGGWHLFSAEAGPAAAVADTINFQVWGDERLLWDSGRVGGTTVVKPRLDLRGVSYLSLRTVASNSALTAHWVELTLKGYEGDDVRFLPDGGRLEVSPERPVCRDEMFDFELVDIPAGTLQTGAPPWGHPRDIHIESFYMGKFEVTQKLWKEVMGKYPVPFDFGDYPLDTAREYENVMPRIKELATHTGFIGDDLPVETVSWEHIQLFLKAISERTGQVYRLPTSAEWEYAYRAGTATAYPFGDDAARLVEYEWYVENSDGRTHPVGLKRPNPWGLYDMGGNVGEWCSDLSDMAPYRQMYPDREWSIGLRRTYRGSHYRHRARAATVTYSHSYKQVYPHESVGFRLVRER